MPDQTNREKFVDDLLDASLRQYSQTGTRDGLEGRVLRRLEEAPKTSWFAGLHWSAVGAFATVLVVALALFTYPPERVTPSPKAQAPPAQAQPGGAVPQVAPPADRAPRMNQTIQQSGVRPNFGGVKPATGELPPCKPDEQPAGRTKDSATKGTKGKKSKVSPDCVPAVPARQQARPAHPPN